MQKQYITDGSAIFEVENIRNDMDILVGDIAKDVDILNNVSLGYRQKLHAYSVDDIVFCSSLPAGHYLSCELAGTTSSSDLPTKNYSEGDPIIDGTARWIVRRIDSGTSPVGVEIGDVANVHSRIANQKVYVRWTDPNDLTYNGAKLAVWGGTLLVRKEGSAPANKNDGIIVVNNKTRNAYKNIGFADSGLENGKTYYYRFFPYTKAYTYTTGTSFTAVPGAEAIPIPYQTGTLTYTGEAQSPTWVNFDSEKMSVTGNEATNAGSYQAIFSITDDYYVWSDGTTTDKTITWSISKATGSVTLSDDSVSLGANNLNETITMTRTGDGAITVSSSDTDVVTASISGNTITLTAVDNGEATVTVLVGEGNNHLSCYTTITVSVVLVSTTLNDNSWDTISAIAQAGEGDLYWDVGDCKEITLNGNIGSNLNLSNQKLCVFILGFNHPVNGVNDNNIIFGGFKTSVTGGFDVALCDSQYGNNPATGTIAFNMNHWWDTTNYGSNFGGWKGCDLRYDILGATSSAPSQYGSIKTTNNSGYDATAATLTNPKANTLLAALPSDFRNVLRLWTRYVDNVGNKSNVDANVTACVDAGVSLLTESEIFSARTYANQYEQNHNSRLAYYAAGNSTRKKKHSDNNSAAYWWESSPASNSTGTFCIVSTSGDANPANARNAYGLAPAFKV